MMRDADRVVAVVLAAGASSRMGRPKALLDFDGTPAVGRVLAACRDGGAGEIVVVTAPGGAEIRAVCRGTIEAINEHPERGMLSSLQAGLARLPAAGGFLIFPVDFPIVPAREVQALIDAFRGRAPGQRIFIPSFDFRRGHPVLVEAPLAAEFLALSPESSARAVMAVHEREIAYVPAEDDRVLMDMDTPEDYRRCLQRSRRP